MRQYLCIAVLASAIDLSASENPFELKSNLAQIEQNEKRILLELSKETQAQVLTKKRKQKVNIKKITPKKDTAKLVSEIVKNNSKKDIDAQKEDEAKKLAELKKREESIKKEQIQKELELKKKRELELAKQSDEKEKQIKEKQEELAKNKKIAEEKEKEKVQKEKKDTTQENKVVKEAKKTVADIDPKQDKLDAEAAIAEAYRKAVEEMKGE